MALADFSSGACQMSFSLAATFSLSFFLLVWEPTFWIFILRTLLYTIDEQNKLLPISFIMCDIDGLKAVNDTYGHDKGNEYITLCHEVMRSSLHAEDYIFRLGGDEFLAILTNTERQVVQERVKTIESKMKTIKKEYHTSISLGSATAEKTPIDSAQLIKEADEEMYQKKAQRKNRL